MNDFMTADVDDLMKEPPVEDMPSVNDILTDYDKELMSFKTRVSHKQQWPSPIRKRKCIK